MNSSSKFSSTRGFLGPSLQLGAVAGIPIRVHWSFSLLLLWVAFANFSASASLTTALLSVLFVLVIFACVVLHELGHSLTAARYGIPTRSITLCPIGGLAALESSPRNWKEEWWITIAGPAVNAVIALLLLPFVILSAPSSEVLLQPFASASGFLLMIFAANVMLTLFNLVPAFPMDGGRILRALLTPMVGRLGATRTASRAGQICAVAMGIAGLFLSPFLVVIAVFVFIAAAAERRSVETEEALNGTTVSDAMRSSFETASHSDTVDEAILLSLRGGQNTLPVMFNGHLLGLVGLSDLIRARSVGLGSVPVSEFIHEDPHPVSPGDGLLQTLHEMQRGSREVMPVVRDERLVGLLPRCSILSLMSLRGS